MFQLSTLASVGTGMPEGSGEILGLPQRAHAERRVGDSATRRPMRALLLGWVLRHRDDKIVVMLLDRLNRQPRALKQQHV